MLFPATRSINVDRGLIFSYKRRIHQFDISIIWIWQGR
jgi:hypothetical protein